jgi:hypothetical protein
VSSATSVAASSVATQSAELRVLLDPVTSLIDISRANGFAGVARATIVDARGISWAEGTFQGTRYRLSTAEIPAGRYTLRVTDDYGVVSEKQILIKR